MNNLLVLLLIVVSSFLLESCIDECKKDGVDCNVSYERFLTIKSGMTLEKVIQILGDVNSIMYQNTEDTRLGAVLEDVCIGRRWIRCRNGCENNVEITICFENGIVSNKKIFEYGLVIDPEH